MNPASVDVVRGYGMIGCDLNSRLFDRYFRGSRFGFKGPATRQTGFSVRRILCGLVEGRAVAPPQSRA